MAIYTQNQVRQFYVVNEVVDYQSTATLQQGEIRVHDSSDGTMYFEYKGADGNQVRSDIIKKANILNVQFTPANKMKRTSVATFVALDSTVNGGLPIPGEDYLLNIRVNQYCNPSDDNYIFKYGVVGATAAMASDASAFYIKMAMSLAKNFSREIQPLLKFYLTEAADAAHVDFTNNCTEVTATTLESSLAGTYTGIVIDEAPQDWHLGKMTQEAVLYEVYPDTVVSAGLRVTWGTAETITGNEEFENGKNIADLEYFYHGERGDIYRGIGWPHTIETTLTANPSKTYDVIDIHYYTDLANHAVQKQEKDISLAIATDATAGTSDLITDLNTIVGDTIATYDADDVSHWPS